MIFLVKTQRKMGEKIYNDRKKEKKMKQAGAKLCQAQDKHRLAML